MPGLPPQPRWAAEVAAVTVLNWTEACARSCACVCVGRDDDYIFGSADERLILEDEPLIFGR